MIGTDIAVPASGPRGRSSPSKRKYRERQVVRHQPRQVLAPKSLLTPAIYHSPSCYLQLGKDKRGGGGGEIWIFKSLALKPTE